MIIPNATKEIKYKRRNRQIRHTSELNTETETICTKQQPMQPRKRKNRGEKQIKNQKKIDLIWNSRFWTVT